MPFREQVSFERRRPREECTTLKEQDERHKAAVANVCRWLKMTLLPLLNTANISEGSPRIPKDGNTPKLVRQEKQQMAPTVVAVAAIDRGAG